MADRFEAEAILRTAASGQIPSVGDVLIRTESGWIFGKVSIGVLEGIVDPDQISSLPFTKITGVILPGQVPEAVVTQHEGALQISFTQMTDEIFDAQVPRSAVFQHLDEVFEWLDFLIARAVTNRPTSPAEKLYMAENYG